MAFDSESAREAGAKSTRKGVQNKTNLEIREAFQKLISGKLPKLSEWIEEVAQEKPEKALELIIKMSEFILPKLERVHYYEEKPQEENTLDVSKLSDATLYELSELYKSERIK